MATHCENALEVALGELLARTTRRAEIITNRAPTVLEPGSESPDWAVPRSSARGQCGSNLTACRPPDQQLLSAHPRRPAGPSRKAGDHPTPPLLGPSANGC